MNRKPKERGECCCYLLRCYFFCNAICLCFNIISLFSFVLVETNIKSKSKTLLYGGGQWVSRQKKELFVVPSMFVDELSNNRFSGVSHSLNFIEKGYISVAKHNVNLTYKTKCLS